MLILVELIDDKHQVVSSTYATAGELNNTLNIEISKPSKVVSIAIHHGALIHHIKPSQEYFSPPSVDIDIKLYINNALCKFTEDCGLFPIGPTDSEHSSLNQTRILEI